MQLDKLKYIKVDEIDSTNNYLINNYKKLNNFTIIRALNQTNGRGQFDRKWISNKNENLLFSILLKDIPIIEINNIRNIIKESLLELLNLYEIRGNFKEPNDILVDNKKILGILIETKNKNYDIFSYIVIGIGININQVKFNELDATSFKLLKNQDFNLDDVITKFITVLSKKIKGD